MSAALVLEEQVELIDGIDTAYDGFKYLRTLCDSLGYDRFTVLSVQNNADSLAKLSVVSNWDPELTQVYDGEGLAAGSPILNHAATSVRPLLYEIDSLPQDRGEKKKVLSTTLFNDFNMQAGTCLPVRNSSGVHGAISFSGVANHQPLEKLLEAHTLAHYLFDAISDSKTSNNISEVTLSTRERDCLCWTASGKTAAEIGLILTLSEHTVVHYLTSAAKKLDAVNRVQAVAKAIRLGLLSE